MEKRKKVSWGNTTIRYPNSILKREEEKNRQKLAFQKLKNLANNKNKNENKKNSIFIVFQEPDQ